MEDLLFYSLLLVFLLALTYLLRKNPELKEKVQDGIEFAIDLYYEARKLVGEEVFDDIVNNIKEKANEQKEEFIDNVNKEYNGDYTEFKDAIIKKLVEESKTPLTKKQVEFAAKQIIKTLQIELKVEKGMKKDK